MAFLTVEDSCGTPFATPWEPVAGLSGMPATRSTRPRSF